MIGNLPVFVAGGGTISLSNPVVNLSGNNTLTIAPGSAVISVTGVPRSSRASRAGPQYCQERVSDQTFRL